MTKVKAEAQIERKYLEKYICIYTDTDMTKA